MRHRIGRPRFGQGPASALGAGSFAVPPPETSGPWGYEIGAWVEVVPEAPKNSQLYVRVNDSWQIMPTGGGTGTAAAITFAPTGNIAAVNVQTALAELDTEKVAKAGGAAAIMTGSLTLPAGTAAATAVHFGTAGTGLYGGAAAINFSIGGTNRFAIANAGITATLPITLPANPTNNLEAATKQYVDSTVAGVVSGAIIADTAPSHAQGKMWWESDTGILWLSYNDTTSTQWVGVGGAAVSSDASKADVTYVNAQDALKVNKAGDTMTGDLVISKADASMTIHAPASGGAWIAIGSQDGVSIWGSRGDAYNPAKTRWGLFLGDGGIETGGNAGSDFTIQACTDLGAPFETFRMRRQTGQVNIHCSTPTTYPTTGALVVNGGLGVGGGIHAGSTIHAYNVPSNYNSLRLLKDNPGAVLMDFYEGTVAQYTLGLSGSDGRFRYWYGDAFTGLTCLVIHPDQINIPIGTGSTSPITGALIVAGGAGVGGSVIAGGSLGFGQNGWLGPGAIYSDANWGILIHAKTAAPALYELGFLNAEGTNRFIVTPTGRLHINSTEGSTTTTNGALTVAGGIGASAGVCAQFFSGQGTPFSTTVYSSRFAGQSQFGMWIDDSQSIHTSALMMFSRGDVASYLGGISNNNNTGVLYNTTSDGRFKPNRERLSLDYARGIIDDLEVYDYDKDGNEIRGIGLIAQQAHEIHPSLATPASERVPVWMAEKAAPMPFVIANVQMLNKRLDDLERRLRV